MQSFAWELPKREKSVKLTQAILQIKVKKAQSCPFWPQEHFTFWGWVPCNAVVKQTPPVHQTLAGLVG